MTSACIATLVAELCLFRCKTCKSVGVFVLLRLQANAQDVNGNPYKLALNLSELKRLRRYTQMWPGRAYVLGQDAFKFPNKSDRKILMTQVKQQGIVWVHDHNRWLSPLEMLSLQCFPVFEQCAINGEKCSFRIPRSGRSGRRILEQSGN